MILTITLNLAIDKVIKTKALKSNGLNRVEVVSSLPGGKGVNVARAINSLGEKAVVSGFAGGFNGRFIERKLKEEGLTPMLFKIEQESRICNIILDKEGAVTEIYEKGPVVKVQTGNDYLKYAKNFSEFDFVAISGSLPEGLRKDYYARLIRKFNENQKIFVDFSGEVLIKALETRKCFMMKVNMNEFESTFSLDATSRNLESISKEFNVPVISITFGEEGSIIHFEKSTYRLWSQFKVKVVNPVGAGDAYLGGFIYKFSKSYNVLESTKVALASSISNVTLLEGGKINKDNFTSILNETYIKEE